MAFKLGISNWQMLAIDSILFASKLRNISDENDKLTSVLTIRGELERTMLIQHYGCEDTLPNLMPIRSPPYSLRCAYHLGYSSATYIERPSVPSPSLYFLKQLFWIYHFY